jgi:hypothetical protein
MKAGMEDFGDWSQYGGYGLFCGKKCAEAKAAAGIPPSGRKLAKLKEADAELLMAEAAMAAQNQEDRSWSPLAVSGVVAASLMGIALMVVIIRKSRNK